MKSLSIPILFVTISMVAGLALISSQVSCSSSIRDSTVLSKEKLKSSNISTEIPTVGFCEVLRNPFLYESKIISIRGNLGRFQDYITFYDENCVPTHPLINVVFDPSFQNNIKNDEANSKLNQIIQGDKEATKGKIHVIVSTVGLFEAIPQNKLKDYSELQYQFTIREINQD